MPQKLHILYISDRIHSKDGSSVHGKAFIDSVRKLGHRVTPWPPAPSAGPGAQRGVRSGAGKKRLQQRFKDLENRIKETAGAFSGWVDPLFHLAYNIKNYVRMTRLIAKDRPDIIIFRQRLFNLAPYWIARIHDIPVINEINALKKVESGLLSEKRKLPGMIAWGEKIAINSGDAVFVVSKALQNGIREYSFNKEVIVVPNGVDTEVFDPARHNSDTIKTSLGLNGKTVLGYVGSYQKWHGLEISIDIIERLQRVDKKYHLLLIGNGRQYPAIQKRIREKRLDHAVTLLPSVCHSAIPAHIGTFDFALMTYPAFNGFYFSPLKLFEYMAMGICVIATGIGQISDVIEHRKSGMLVNPPEPENFVDAILEAESDISAMGSEARNRVQRQYTWQINAQSIIDLAHRTLEQKRQRMVQ
jgi:glycosyltransferase involved in cell wall biosynthesis